MLIRGSPNGLRHSHPQLVAIPGMGGRDPSERVVVFNRNEWSRSIGIAGRDQPVRALAERDRRNFKILRVLGTDPRVQRTAGGCTIKPPPFV
jgi:hypothetical protein